MSPRRNRQREALPKKPGFLSTEVTCTGSAQTVAHGLGGIPAAIVFAPTELPIDLTAGFDIAEGTHTTTNIAFTGTASCKVKIMAWIN